MQTNDSFSFASVENFDEHINDSVRGYDNMISDVVGMTQYFLEAGTHMVDIGCSTGKMLNEIEHVNRSIIKRVKYIGIENERNMIQNQIANPSIEYYNGDVRDYKGFDSPKCTMITSIFTLQFIEKAFRQALLYRIYSALHAGGAFVFTEKVYSKDARMQDIMTFMYYTYKQGKFSPEDILNKEKSLRHMLRPNTERELIGMLKTAGFEKIEPFWQNFSFRGWVAIK